MSLYEAVVPPVTRMLTNVDSWIDVAHDHADKKKFDPATLLVARLAPDQFPLLRQLQSVCDQGKYAVSRPAGKTAPSHPDTEQTWDQIRARLRAVREYAESFQPSDYDGAEKRMVPLAFMPGKGMLAPEYVHDMVLPNFYFHASMTYAILRHNGVDLGKRNFLGNMTFRDL